jgi:hypothetical protein
VRRLNARANDVWACSGIADSNLTTVDERSTVSTAIYDAILPEIPLGLQSAD